LLYLDGKMCFSMGFYCHRTKPLRKTATVSINSLCNKKLIQKRLQAAVARSSCCMTMPGHMLLRRPKNYYWSLNGKFSLIQLIHQTLFLLIIIQIDNSTVDLVSAFQISQTKIGWSMDHLKRWFLFRICIFRKDGKKSWKIM